MEIFQTILVPTDFGEAAHRAVELALSLREKFDASLILLHVHFIPTNAIYSEGMHSPIEYLEREARKSFENDLRALRKIFPEVEAIFEIGSPSETIIRVAEAKGADLIVMGTRRKRAFLHMLMGSVAQKVVQRSHIPVLTVHPDQPLTGLPAIKAQTDMFQVTR